MPKRAGRIAGGLDDMIISLYAHGMSVRDIIHHLEQVYGTQLSHETVSRITDAVLEEVRAWQSRPLEPGLRRRLPGECVRYFVRGIFSCPVPDVYPVPFLRAI